VPAPPSEISGQYAEAPIARHRSWRHLLRWLVEQGDRRLVQVSQKDLTARLVSVATLARWIAWQDLAFPKAGRWRIAIVGAQELDTFDRGKWYGLLPALLGSEGSVEISFVGPRLTLGASRFPPVGPSAVGAVEVRAYPGALSECWQDIAQEPPDLAFLFQPGFETNDSWFEGPGFRTMVASGVPVGVSSYGRDEYVIDRTVLRARGYSSAGPAVENPFHMEMGHPSSRWGHTLWRLTGEAPGPAFQPSTDLLQAIRRLSRMLTRLFQAGYASDPLAFGTDVDVPLPEGGRGQMIYLLGDLYADPQTGALKRRRGHQWQALEASLAPQALRARPPQATDSLDRALWAAELVERLLYDEGRAAR
jgi:hypothetical protein